MKILFILLLSSTSAFGQVFTFKQGSVTFHTDTMKVEEAFKFMGKILPWEYRSQTRYVIKDGQKYMRHYAPINRLLNKTYVIEEGKRKRVTI